MTKDNTQVVQAVPLNYGKINLTTGTYDVKNLIHCEAGGDVTLHFPQGDITYSMSTGDDRCFSGSLTIVSGTFTID